MGNPLWKSKKEDNFHINWLKDNNKTIKISGEIIFNPPTFYADLITLEKAKEDNIPQKIRPLVKLK